MRLRAGIGLPGPFVVTGSRRRRPSNGGFAPVAVLVIVVCLVWFGISSL